MQKHFELVGLARFFFFSCAFSAGFPEEHNGKVPFPFCNCTLFTHSLATVDLKSGTTTKPVALVPVNKMSGIITTAALTPAPPQLQTQQ